MMFVKLIFLCLVFLLLGEISLGRIRGGKHVVGSLRSCNLNLHFIQDTGKSTMDEKEEKLCQSQYGTSCFDAFYEFAVDVYSIGKDLCRENRKRDPTISITLTNCESQERIVNFSQDESDVEHGFHTFSEAKPHGLSCISNATRSLLPKIKENNEFVHHIVILQSPGILDHNDLDSLETALKELSLAKAFLFFGFQNTFRVSEYLEAQNKKSEFFQLFDLVREIHQVQIKNEIFGKLYWKHTNNLLKEF